VDKLPANVNPDLFEPFDRFVEIEVLGKRVSVPDNNTILRCFQFLSSYTISYGKFCWNNDCGNCECQIVLPGKTEAVTKRTCCTKVREGMKIVATSRWVRLKL
jgi:predicted molibdopterin-dependent oxidoreductase YjgC